MQAVTDRWYVIYARGGLGLAIILFALSLMGLVLPDGQTLQGWGFSGLTTVLAGAIIVYYPLLYRRYADFSSSYNAALVIAILHALIIFTLLPGSGDLHSLWLVLWLIEVVAGGLFGSYALIACGFLVLIYLLATGASPVTLVTHDPLSAGVVTLTAAAAIAGHFFWRTRYVDRESQQISHLSKLLKDKQLRSEALIQAIGEGVLAVDPEGTILLMNPAAAAMVEWSLDEALGINARSVMIFNDDKGQPLPVEQNPFQQLGNITEPATYNVNLVSKKDATRIVSLVISPVTQQGSQEIAAFVAVFRDVTAARAEEQRRADFISTASHEMRTPVAAIEGYLALALNEKVSKIDAKAREYLEKAHTSAQHLGRLFQDLLTSAKAEDGRLVSHPEVIEMGTYLEQLTDSLKFSAQKKGLLTDFTIGVSGSTAATQAGGKVVRPLYYTLADPERLREVITNLFDNAVKYTESGRVSVGLTGNDSVVQFFIKDTGHGIPKEDIPHLFQKFYRVDNTATRTIGGTGLGLFISRKIIELYNGRIWVDSEFGKGSTFYINLPRLSSAKALELQEQQTGGKELVIPKSS